MREVSREHRVEHVSDPSDQPPRVRVHLPGDVPARLVRWRQDRDGQWWAEVTLYAPAEAVQQVAGEDYTAVPREPAAQPGEYVVVAPKVAPGEKPTAELHRADCFIIPKASTSTLLVTPMPDAKTARDMLRFDDTTPCTACRPDP
jgi:hypothetical protein